ncbi:hypothetical protein OMF49_13030 [Bordetella pertussis]
MRVVDQHFLGPARDGAGDAPGQHAPGRQRAGADQAAGQQHQRRGGNEQPHQDHGLAEGQQESDRTGPILVGLDEVADPVYVCLHAENKTVDKSI